MVNMIGQNVSQILSELPEGVQLLAAAKGRQPQEILAAVAAGVEIIGENYVQEAERAYKAIGNRVKWHFIGHLQKNKVKKAVRLFDMIESVDSLEIAREIDKRCAQIGKIMPVLIEVNSAREKQKSGVFPEEVAPLISETAALPNLRVEGLMTIGPDSANPEDLRLVFAETRKTFDRISQLNLPGVEMRYLSMGMTNSYKIALEEGSNIVRLGSKIFGERDYEED